MNDTTKSMTDLVTAHIAQQVWAEIKANPEQLAKLIEGVVAKVASGSNHDFETQIRAELWRDPETRKAVLAAGQERFRANMEKVAEKAASDAMENFLRRVY